MNDSDRPYSAQCSSAVPLSDADWTREWQPRATAYPEYVTTHRATLDQVMTADDGTTVLVFAGVTQLEPRELVLDFEALPLDTTWIQPANLQTGRAYAYVTRDNLITGIVPEE